jgi:hypothetical protein
MKLKLNAKNPRIVEDENGDQVFIFTGLYLKDLQHILTAINSREPEQI